jgi:hypothetical protein
MTVEPPRTTSSSSAATEGIAVVEHKSRMVHLYVPRRTRDTRDEDFAARIEEMSRLRREWLDRGYGVKLIH